jgi:hypothetical protein
VFSWTLTLRWLTIKPDWLVRDHSFDARTRWSLRLLSLFAYDRHLHIDTNRQIVVLKVRRFWLSNSKSIIPFTRIKSIVYGYSAGIGLDVSDRPDEFHVGLLLNDAPSPVTLFTFRADVAWLANIAATEWLEDDSIEIAGDEEDASREFVALLRKQLGVPARSAMHTRVRAALLADLQPCPKCERKLMKTAIGCVYCGSKFKTAA